MRSYLLDWICDRLPETVNSKESMVSWLEENQSGLESAAGHFLMQKGISYQAHLSLERTYFPTRVYDDLVIPCGTYDAARVILGKGKGHNWWCVLYPRFCFLDEVCKEIPEESRDKLRDKLKRIIALMSKSVFSFFLVLILCCHHTAQAKWHSSYSTVAKPSMPQS